MISLSGSRTVQLKKGGETDALEIAEKLNTGVGTASIKNPTNAENEEDDDVIL